MENKKYLFLLFLPLLFACQGNKDVSVKVLVPNQTLIASSNGKLINFDLETKSVTWLYVSEQDTAGNRNYYTYDEASIYLPFESGKLMSVDIVTGKINWEDHPSYHDGTMDRAVGEFGNETYSNATSDLCYMTTPLVFGNEIYITTSEQEPKFIVLDKKSGALIGSSNVPTRFNLYKPVVCRDHIFSISAIYLNMYSKNGTWTSYGQHELYCLETPLYMDPQSDGETLYLGEEAGKFYALPFNSSATLSQENDATESDSDCQKLTGLFKWTYQSEKYSKLVTKFNNTALIDDSFIVWVREDGNEKHALVGIDTDTGKEKWIFEADDEIVGWNVSRNKIIGYTNSHIFILDGKGNSIDKIPVDPNLVPLSNIVSTETSDLVFLTTEGVVFVNNADKKMTLQIPYPFTKNEHNVDYIQYFGK